MSEEWQDISTAPKDGTIIRVRCGEKAPYRAVWNGRVWMPLDFGMSAPPTHWMPEPEKQEEPSS